MKKLYFLIAAFALLQINAQVIFSQPIYYAPNGSSSAFKSGNANNGDLISLASQFTLSQAATLSKVTIYGYQLAQNLPTLCTGALLYIYADNNGEPAGHPILQTGTPLFSLNISNTSPAFGLVFVPNALAYPNYNFVIDLGAVPGQPTLQDNTTYWLFFVPKLNIPNISTYDSRVFAWYRHDPATPSYKAISNLSGAAAFPTWTSLGTGGAAFTIEGINELGTEEIVFDSSQILIYPNPATDLVFIRSKEKIKSAKLYDASGKIIIVELSENTLNISDLPIGNYFLHLETESQKVVKKIIKK